MTLAPPDLRSEGPEPAVVPWSADGTDVSLGGVRLVRGPLSRRERKRIDRAVAGASPEERGELRRQLLGGSAPMRPGVREALDIPRHVEPPETPTIPAGVVGNLLTSESARALSLDAATTQEAATPMPHTIELRPDVELEAKVALVAAVEQQVLTELGVAPPPRRGGKPSRRERREAKRPKAIRFADCIDLADEVLVLTDGAESVHVAPTAGAGVRGASPDPNVTYVVRETTPLRIILTIFVWVVMGAGMSLGALLAAPPLVGHKTMVVLSGSMTPTLDIGDVVIDRTIDVLDVKMGDIITFRDPIHPKRTVTHRVRAMSVKDGTVTFTTRGDANTSNESWKIPSSGKIGRVVLRVPKLGYVLGWAWSPKVRVGFVVVPMLFFGALEIAAIWRSPDDPAPKARKGKGGSKARK
ncbi:MAG: signal peptidase I [Actinobacteria bacterium]|nr:signal peptidase I [Actinomycetota bacterium]